MHRDMDVNMPISNSSNVWCREEFLFFQMRRMMVEFTLATNESWDSGQRLSTCADCQSPILAIHSYKQCYLNSKLHSNNIDVIKPAATPADNKEIKANKKPSIKKNKARNNSRSSFDINFTINDINNNDVKRYNALQ